MSTNTNQSEEIDLGYLFRKINIFFKNCVKTAFMVLHFFLKYKFIVLALILIGFVYGLYKENSTKKVYLSQGIIIPNFESVDYLYDNVDVLNSKIRLGDTLFLKKVLDTNYRRIRAVEIEPIIDIYNFASKSRENIDVFRILFQNQDLSEFVNDMTTSKYYKYHRIRFNILGNATSEKVVADIINYWNSNSHYNGYSEIYKTNTALQVEEHKYMILQIDSIITAITSLSKEERVTNQGIIFKEYGSLSGLLERKRDLMDELLAMEMKMFDYEKPLKIVSMDYNIKKLSGIPGTIKYPLILVFLFSAIFLTKYFYKKLKRIAEDNQ